MDIFNTPITPQEKLNGKTATEIYLNKLNEKEREIARYYNQQRGLMSKYSPRHYGYYENKHCRLCGKMVDEGENYFRPFELCADCHKKFLNRFFKEMFEGRDDYCKKCLYHIKACQCEEKKKLDNLKQ